MDPSPDTIAAMFEAVSLGAPEHAIGFVMWRVTHRFQRDLERALLPLDLTHLQFTILALVAWMGRSAGPATQADLSRFGDIHPMQVSNVLKALEGKAMVHRTPAGGHALAKHVRVTASGLEAVRAAMPLAREVQFRLFGESGKPGGSLLEALLRIDAMPRD